MRWSLYFTEEVPRMAVFVSQPTHCLYDLLLRHKQGQFRCGIPLIISNHSAARTIAAHFNIRFVELAKTVSNKKEIEEKERALLEKERIELIVLAQYKQILSESFVEAFPWRIINIHHSFLPAFAGSEPYQQAYRRGVKIIGATSHYVTRELDAGPIIEQDTVRVSHRDSLDDLKRKGQDLEKVVLSRAIRWHLERKILVYNNKTVVFD
jgi:formyltetrahydrofolate deformylase